MRRANFIVRIFNWALALIFLAGAYLFLPEMGVKLPPEITDKITQIINTIMQR